MEHFDDLASSLSEGVSDVRGCLILSKDGLVLAAHPENGEMEAKHAWVRFAALGDPERGFAQFGVETWCYVRRGPYAAFAIVGPGVRPGVAIDGMEQVLLAAEEYRSKPQGAREPAPAAPTPTTKPRTSLHPESRPAGDPVVITSDVAVPVAAQVPASAPAPVEAPHGGRTNDGPTAAPATDPPGDPADTAGPQRSEEPEAEALGGKERDTGVDRFSLAREFGQLLQDDEAVADG